MEKQKLLGGVMNPWHSVDWPVDASIFPAVITMPKESSVRYVLDKESGLLKVAALLAEGSRYPGNGGLVPRTATSEKLPLEALILGERGLQSLSIARVKAIGLFRSLSRGQVDVRLVCVHCDDAQVAEYETLAQYPQYRLAQLRSFLEEEMKESGWEGEITGTGGREEAMTLVRECRARYEETFSKMR
jgi:inorganic pyrophosphatase